MRKTSGVSLMLLIFLSLCLIVFSLLSLSGAVADETLSSQAAERTTEYYAAVTAANSLLAQIDGQLAEYLREAETSGGSGAADGKSTSGDLDDSSTGQKETKYLELCSQIGDAVPDVFWEGNGENDADDGTISFSVDVNDEQLLQVRLGISYPNSESDTLYQIHSWKIINTGDWNADNSMNLFRSEDMT